MKYTEAIKNKHLTDFEVCKDFVINNYLSKTKENIKQKGEDKTLHWWL